MVVTMRLAVPGKRCLCNSTLAIAEFIARHVKVGTNPVALPEPIMPSIWSLYAFDYAARRSRRAHFLGSGLAIPVSSGF